MASPLVDDWESIGADDIQQIAAERQRMIKEDQKSAAREQRCFREVDKTAKNTGLGNTDSLESNDSLLVNKPLKLLKRERPSALQNSLDELGGSRALGAGISSLTLDEREAKYQIARERIFNASSTSKDSCTEKDVTKDCNDEKSKKTPDKAPSTSIDNEKTNHLSNVQMLSSGRTFVNRAKTPGQGIPPMNPVIYPMPTSKYPFPNCYVSNPLPPPPPTWLVNNVSGPPPNQPGRLPYGCPTVLQGVGQGVFPSTASSNSNPRGPPQAPQSTVNNGNPPQWMYGCPPTQATVTPIFPNNMTVPPPTVNIRATPSQATLQNTASIPLQNQPVPLMSIRTQLPQQAPVNSWPNQNNAGKTWAGSAKTSFKHF